MPNLPLLRKTTLLPVVLLVALTGALLLNRWLARQPVAADADAGMRQQTALNTLNMQEQLADSLTEKTTSARQQRLDSPLGQALFRQCSEWTEFNENHADEASRRHRDQACSQFRAYVESGVNPGDKADSTLAGDH